MVKFEHQGYTYKLYFSHPIRTVAELERRGVKFDYRLSRGVSRRCTECTTYINDTPITGFTVCNQSDNFCKSEGRKRALTRLLQRLAREFPKHSYGRVPFSSKEFRKAAWKAYFSGDHHVRPI